MIIQGLAACVGFADLLAKTLAAWQESLDDLVVVTTPTDRDTLDLCRHARAKVHLTEAFTADGAAFNKGRALEEAREAWYGYAASEKHWLLLYDADVLPEPGWRRLAESAQPGFLYGGHRYQFSPNQDVPSAQELPAASFGKYPFLPVAAAEIPGCFQLFHLEDPRAACRPLIPTHWSHAGCYDSELCYRWPPERRVRLPFRLMHLGEAATYWHGPEDRDAAKARMQAMYRERKLRGQTYDHERIQPLHETEAFPELPA